MHLNIFRTENETKSQIASLENNRAQGYQQSIQVQYPSTQKLLAIYGKNTIYNIIQSELKSDLQKWSNILKLLPCLKRV